MDTIHLSDLLNPLVERTAYRPSQLAQLTDLPKSTIVNWLQGHVSRPRQWQPLVRLLGVLHVSDAEADAVLSVAGHPTLAELRRLATAEERALFELWRAEPATLPPPFQAMAPPHSFVAREAELAQLRRWLGEGGICVVHGLSGTGKTALAAVAAARFRDLFPDGVLWASLATSDLLAVMATFARAYGVRVDYLSDVDSRGRVVRSLLAERRALIVLDGVADSGALSRLLPSTGDCAALITTRRPHLRAAPAARHLELRPFAADSGDSERLFAAVLGEERTREEAPQLAELSALLGHLPLALAIVAARLAYEPGWRTRVLVERLRVEAELSLLTYDDQSVRVSFDVSAGALGGDVRTFFSTLALFAGPFRVDEAAAAAGTTLAAAADHLRALYRLSLVEATGAGLYRLHPLLRLYARDGLQEPGPAVARLADFYREEIAAHEDGTYCPTADPDHAASANIAAVLEGAWEADETAAYVGLVLIYAPDLIEHGRLARARTLLERVATVPEEGDRLTSGLLLAEIERREGRLEDAALRLRQLRPLTAGDPARAAALALPEGKLAARRGDFVEACRRLREALAETEVPSLRARLLQELGMALLLDHDCEQAADHYEAALAVAKAGAPEQLPAIYRLLGSLKIHCGGDYEAAVTLFERGLTHLGDRCHPDLQIPLLNNLATVALAQGRLDDARTWLEQAERLVAAGAQPWLATIVLGNRGKLAVLEGRHGDARRDLQETHKRAMALRNTQLAAAVEQELALLDARDQPDAASPPKREPSVIYN